MIFSPQATNKKTRGISLFLIFSWLLVFLSAACSCSPHREKIFKKNRILMDTIVTITVVSDSESQAEKAINKAFSIIEKLQSMMNFYSPDSEISFINRQAGASAVRVSQETLDVVKKALYVSQKTEGAFDITAGPLTVLYDFRKGIKHPDREILKNLAIVNYKLLLLDEKNSSIFLTKRGMLIDPGGIAKGFAADKAVELLKSQGISSGLVSIAGDIKAFGKKPDGNSWKVGIKNPRAKGTEDDILATISLDNMSISTSGDYERFFMKNAKRYHHLLDPKTGYPAERCRSVTIITKEGAFADAFATGIFIMGPIQGLELLRQLGLDGIIVDSSGKLHTTTGVSEKLEFKRYS